MELQIQKENINIQKIIGGKNKRVVIEKDYILPDSKPDIIKIQAENSLTYTRKKEIMENKVKIDGGIETRITYITDEGKNRVLRIEDELSETIEIEGINQESNVAENISIIQMSSTILNERKIHYKIEVEIQTRAFRKENVELIHEINKMHNIETLNKKIRIDTYIGHSESKISVKEKLEIENLQERIEVIKFKPNIENIEKKISYNKILVKADCQMKCIYQSESGSIYQCKKEVPIMGFLDIENVDEECESNIEINLKNISINESTTTQELEVEMEFNLLGDVYQPKETNMMVDLYGINCKANCQRQTISLEKTVPNICQKIEVENKELIEDINQIYDQEYKIKEINNKENKIEIQIQAIFLYSSFENENINKKEITIKKEINSEYRLENVQFKIKNENTVLLPDANIQTNLEIIIQSNETEKLNIINQIELEDEEKDDQYSMIIYFVKEGDSLWTIAKRFKSTIKEISNVNEIDDENKVCTGDKLYIPRAI